MAFDAPAPENGRQTRRRRMRGGVVTIHDTTINQSEQEATKAEASAVSGVNTVEDDKAEKAKKEKEGVDKVENPEVLEPGHRQINPPTKAGTRQTMLGINIVDTWRRRRGGRDGSLS